MGYRNKLNRCALMLAIAGSIWSFSASAATSIETKNSEFTVSNANQIFEVKTQSWFNPTMGFTGWTHHSDWGYMKLKKGKPVTITLETTITGFHPALTVWYRPQKEGLVSVNYVDDHFYNPFQDIIASNAQLTDDPANPVKLGKIKMLYVANAFDRDGMGDALPEEFDQSMLNRVLDGTPGKVSLTFTPESNGVYQFVVGGINPDASALLDNEADYSVTVTVSFPE